MRHMETKWQIKIYWYISL